MDFNRRANRVAAQLVSFLEEGRLYTKQTKKTKNFVMHPPGASLISGSQALAAPEIPKWLAGGSPLPRFQTGSRALAPRTRGIGDNDRQPIYGAIGVP